MKNFNFLRNLLAVAVSTVILWGGAAKGQATIEGINDSLTNKYNALKGMHNTLPTSEIDTAKVPSAFYTPVLAGVNEDVSTVKLNGATLSTASAKISMGNNHFTVFYPYVKSSDTLYIATVILTLEALDDGQIELEINDDSSNPFNIELNAMDVEEVDIDTVKATTGATATYESNTINYSATTSRTSLLKILFDVEELQKTDFIFTKKVQTLDGAKSTTSYGSTDCDATGGDIGLGYYVFGWEWPQTEAGSAPFALEVDYTIFILGHGFTQVRIEGAWKSYEHQVIYKGNGGRFSITKADSVAEITTSTIEITSVKPTRPGYTFAGWNSEADGTGEKVEGNVNIEPDSDTTFYAQWIKQFEVIFSSSANGTLAADTNEVSISTSPVTLDSATEITFTATPNANYIVKRWLTGENNDTILNKTDSTYTIVLNSDTTIKVDFALIQYRITAKKEGNGTVTPADTLVDYGTSATISITPETGYKIDSVLVNGIQNDQAKESGNYTFENVLGDSTIKAFFSADSADITLASLTVSYAGMDSVLNINGDTVRVNYDTASVTITATATDSKATVSGDSGVQALRVGKNTFTLTVTDTFYTDRSKSYNVVIFRLPAQVNDSTILDISPIEDSKVAITMPTGTTVFSDENMLDSIANAPNSIIFEKPFSPENTVSKAYAGCSVDSIKLDVTDLEGRVEKMMSSLKNGENTINLGGNYVLKVYKSLDERAIKKKFGTLTFVNNPNNNGVGEEFKSFQWYVNGVPIEGATGQYYVLPPNNELRNRYTVSVTSVSGWLVNTCPIDSIPQAQQQAQSLSVYPNPAAAGGTLSVEVKNLGTSSPLTVEVYDLNGQLVRSSTADVHMPEATAPQRAGSYVVKVRQGERVLGSRVILVK